MSLFAGINYAVSQSMRLVVELGVDNVNRD